MLTIPRVQFFRGTSGGARRPIQLPLDLSWSFSPSNFQPESIGRWSKHEAASFKFSPEYYHNYNDICVIIIIMDINKSGWIIQRNFGFDLQNQKMLLNGWYCYCIFSKPHCQCVVYPFVVTLGTGCGTSSGGLQGKRCPRQRSFNPIVYQSRVKKSSSQRAVTN